MKAAFREKKKKKNIGQKICAGNLLFLERRDADKNEKNIQYL